MTTNVWRLKPVFRQTGEKESINRQYYKYKQTGIIETNRHTVGEKESMYHNKYRLQRWYDIWLRVKLLQNGIISNLHYSTQQKFKVWNLIYLKANFGNIQITFVLILHIQFFVVNHQETYTKRGSPALEFFFLSSYM